MLTCTRPDCRHKGKERDDFYVSKYLCLCGKQSVLWCDDCAFWDDESTEPLPTCNDDCRDAGFTFLEDDELSLAAR